MITEQDFLNIKNFQPDEKVCVFSKGYPVICSVIQKKQKNNVVGYKLKILDLKMIELLGVDELWLPLESIECVAEA